MMMEEQKEAHDLMVPKLAICLHNSEASLGFEIQRG